MKYRFKPRYTFDQSLSRLAKIDVSIVDEVEQAILILLNGKILPSEFDDHFLSGNLSGYREFHLRDTPRGSIQNDINDVIVIYKIDNQDLVVIGVEIGSHRKLFNGKYRKNK